MRQDLERIASHLQGHRLSQVMSGEEFKTFLRGFVESYADVVPRMGLEGNAKVSEVRTPTFAAEWLIPDGAPPDRCIVYFHGGGWIAGSPNSHRPMGLALAKAARCPMLMVDYRLAPEFRFPAGLTDCVAAYEWALSNGHTGKRTPQNIYLMGDSAGGNLAAAACVHLAAIGGRMPDALILISPLLDATLPVERTTDPNFLRIYRAMNTLYVDQGVQLDDPLISPIKATQDLLARFPPTLFQVGAQEPLVWDCKFLLKRLLDAGVNRAALNAVQSMPHVWHLFVGYLPEADQAINEIAQFLENG